MNAARPRSVQFRREREAAWRRLDLLVQRVDERGPSSLSTEEAAALPALYRATLSSLSVARAISLDKNLVEYLDSLCSRAYLVLYAPRETLPRAVAKFFRRGFPAAVRALARPIALAAAAVALGAVVGFLLVTADPELYYEFVSPALAGGRDPAATTETLRRALYDSVSDDGALSFFAAYLFHNNTRVAMLAFFLGIAAGVPTVLVLLVNGMTLGAFAALHHSRGLGVDFWGWLLPHGVTELGAIVLAGGAGLAVGWAVVFPGPRTRLGNLVQVGRLGAATAAGAFAMLFLAGIVESFFRQTVLDPTARYGFAIATAIAWGGYFLAGGRRRG